MTTTIHQISPDAPRELIIQFHGNARDYFRVWVVNLCLTLCTAGLYSAWAKVRKQRYLHAHTTLDGTPFQYLGHPLAILRGRLVAAALVLTYYLVSYLAPDLRAFVIATAVVAAPWILVRSLAFNARVRAFRNLSFNFSASYGETVFALYWLGLIPALVVGWLFEWWEDPRILTALAAAAGAVFPFWMFRLKRFTITHTSFGAQRATFDARPRAFFRIYFVAGVMLIVAAMAFGALIRLFGETGRLGMLLAPVPLYAGYVLSLAYTRAHVGNLVWNNLGIGPVRFQSTLSTWSLFGLYLGNTVCILLSCGLLIPWAVLRTIRYRIEHLRATCSGDLSHFRQSRPRRTDAASAELGDLLQLDLAL